MMYPNDYILMIAEEKVGKTIFCQQLACSMTLGQPFLGVFDIPRPLNVWYIATECKIEELKDRFIRISKKIGVDMARLKLIPIQFMFNTKEGFTALKELVTNYQAPEHKPDVIIIDALYKAIRGSITKDEVVNSFHQVVGWLITKCDCAVWLTHHLTKPSRDSDGNFHSRTDKDGYGSAFLNAGVDHIFRLEKYHNNQDLKDDRMLYCDTQRSDEISDRIRIRIMGRDPLYFERVSKYIEKHKLMLDFLKTSIVGYTLHDIEFNTRLGRTPIYEILGEMIKENLVEKTKGSRPVYYRIKTENKHLVT